MTTRGRETGKPDPGFFARLLMPSGQSKIEALQKEKHEVARIARMAVARAEGMEKRAEAADAARSEAAEQARLSHETAAQALTNNADLARQLDTLGNDHIRHLAGLVAGLADNVHELNLHVQSVGQGQTDTAADVRLLKHVLASLLERRPGDGKSIYGSAEVTEELISDTTAELDRSDHPADDNPAVEVRGE
jgi:hypothetical protein